MDIHTVEEINSNGLHIEEENNKIDLVCGMEVNKNSKYKYIYNSNEYYFCSNNCKKHFENDPNKYLVE